MDWVIIKSRVKGEKNWSGKEFSHLPVKLYSSFEDAFQAIQQYWIGEWNAKQFDNRSIEFRPLTDEQARLLIKKNEARF